MSRVHSKYLNSVCFLYPSRDDAEKGTAYGGSGFFIANPSATKTRNHYYIVTNKHVIQGGNVCVRLETNSGKIDPWQTTLDNWEKSDTDDIAIAHWEPGHDHKFMAIQRGGDLTEFLDETQISPDQLGAGDELFMIGRFVTHKGEQISIPTVRFGNLSIGSTVSVLNDKTNQNQESLIAEVRSMKGYSGSPVFISRYAPGSDRDLNQVDPLRRLFGPWLLGIMWGNNLLPIEAQAWDKKLRKPKGKTFLQLQPNTGMVNIVPVWKLAALLDSPKVIEAQQAIEDGDMMSKKGYVEPASHDKEIPFTRDDFMHDLNKVVRKKPKVSRKKRGKKKNNSPS